ncbi:MAG TPA: DUF4339 domain-containing protein [Pirellulaceae bacterium]|jgi:hypothetical protein
MGIKFHCPNGHKLNVKAFLAGKKGICPKCGTKMLIPTVSEAGLADSESDSDLEVTDPSQAVKSNGSGAIAAASSAAAGSVAAAPSAPAVSAAPATAAASGANDPIAEAPAAIWYVRPPSGGQYGPARGDIMRKWISEGRVSSDSLVWREGWTDWQNAGRLFPTLNESGSNAAAQPAVSAVSTTVPLSAKASQRAVSRYETRKHDSNTMAVAILVGLGILCLILIGILVFVVVRMNRVA